MDVNAFNPDKQSLRVNIITLHFYAVCNNALSGLEQRQGAGFSPQAVQLQGMCPEPLCSGKKQAQVLSIFLLQSFPWGLGVWLTTLTWTLALCASWGGMMGLVLRGESRPGCGCPLSRPRAFLASVSCREPGDSELCCCLVPFGTWRVWGQLCPLEAGTASQGGRWSRARVKRLTEAHMPSPPGCCQRAACQEGGTMVHASPGCCSACRRATASSCPVSLHPSCPHHCCLLPP